MWSNICLIVYIFLWIVAVVSQKSRTQSVGPCLFVMLTYLVYSIITLIYYNSGAYRYYGELSMLPLVYLFIMVIIALMPALSFERSNVTFLQKPSNTIIYAFIIVYSICCAISLVESMITIRTSFTDLFNIQGYALRLYHEAQGATFADDYSVSGFVGLLHVFHSYFRDVSVFILFYYLSLKERKKWISLYLIVVLIVDILISLARGGRTQFVMLLLIVFVAYFTFRDYWDVKQREKIKRISLVALIIVLVPFIVFTFSRFGQSSSNGPLDSILAYTGMENLNFDKYVLDANGTRHGDRTINEIKRLMGFDVPNGVDATRAMYSHMTINDSKFYTFVGDFVLDFGPLVAPIIFILFSFLFRYMTRCNNKVPFHKLLLVYFSLCVCSQGGMYLYYYSFTNFWIVVAFFLMYIAFYVDYNLQSKNGRIVYLEKNTEGKNKRNKRKMIITLKIH